MARDALGHIYIMTHPAWPGFVNVGKTDDPRRRLRQYQCGCPYRAYRFAVTIEVKDYHLAERIAHERLRGFRVGSSEWFNISADDALGLVRAALTRRPSRLGRSAAKQVRDRVAARRR